MIGITHDRQCKWWRRTGFLWRTPKFTVCDCDARTGFKLEKRPERRPMSDAAIWALVTLAIAISAMMTVASMFPR
jgi:hypothetical protein